MNKNIPIIFIGFAWTYLNEPPKRHELLGMAIVFLGVLVTQFGGLWTKS